MNNEVNVPEEAVEALARANYDAASKSSGARFSRPLPPFEQVRKGYEDGARCCFDHIGPAIPIIRSQERQRALEALNNGLLARNMLTVELSDFLHDTLNTLEDPEQPERTGNGGNGPGMDGQEQPALPEGDEGAICSRCGRKERSEEIGNVCEMLQPDGSRCHGTFERASGALSEGGDTPKQEVGSRHGSADEAAARRRGEAPPDDLPERSGEPGTQSSPGVGADPPSARSRVGASSVGDPALSEGVGSGAEEDDFERIARAFHGVYETLAPEYGYESRPESRVPWAEVPEKNRALMIGTVRRLVETDVIAICGPAPPPQAVQGEGDPDAPMFPRPAMATVAGTGEINEPRCGGSGQIEDSAGIDGLMGMELVPCPGCPDCQPEKGGEG